MKSSQPPRLGTLMLERLGAPNDSIVGDLSEEWHAGRSALWYWRQVLVAIVVSATNDIRSHKLLALRAIAVGWLATWVSAWAIGRPLNRFFSGWVLDQLIFTAGSHPFVMLWATDLFNWPRMIAIHLVSGWVVARLHARHGGILVAFMLVAFGQGLFHALSTVQLRIAWTTGPVSLPASLLSIVSQALIPPVFILIGGIWAAKASRNPSPPKNRSAHVCLLLVAALLSAVASTSAAQGSSLDYPQWRGQHRDGAASAFAEPKSWPDALTQRWKIQVGEGYATPLVVGGTVYVFTRRGEREVITALDAMSGTERWHSDYPAEYSPSEAVAVHGAGPKATPLFHEAKLFTLGISGIVSAFDATTGKLLWQTDPPKEPPYFSAASSPLGEEGIVLAHPGNYGPLTAFDSDTGEVRWTAGTDGGFIVSPIAVTLGGTRQIITATEDSVIGVSLGGDVLWRSAWVGQGGSTTPVLYNDMIIVSALDQGVAAIRPVLRDAKWTADTVWHTKDVSMYISNPVVVEDTMFGLSRRNRGQFFALDAKSGRLLWLGQPREAENTAFVKAGYLIFMLNDDAELIVAKANRSMFEPLKRYSVADSATWAQPAISGNRLFVKDVSSLSLWTLN